MIRRYPILFIIALLLAGPSVAKAEPVAPLVPVFKPAKADELVSRFHDALAAGLAGGGVQVISSAVVRKKADRPCASSRCAHAYANRLKTTQAVGMTVETVGKNYTYSLRLFPARKPAVEGRCDICTLMEAVRKTKQLAQSLAVKIKSEAAAPAKAAVKKAAVKKAAVKKAPAKAPLDAETPPDQLAPKKAATGAPKKETTEQPRTETRRSRWPLWPALVASGVGVVGLAVGIPLLSMDGDPTNCRGTPRPDGRNCADLYATAGPGWAFTAMGLAGAVTAGVLFYLYLRSPNAEASKKASSPKVGWLPQLKSSADGRSWVIGAVGRF
jgi:hypothetical protein